MAVGDSGGTEDEVSESEFEPEDDDLDDDWVKARGFINGFNRNRVKLLYSSVILVLDETMSSFVPR